MRTNITSSNFTYQLLRRSESLYREVYFSSHVAQKKHFGMTVHVGQVAKLPDTER